MKTRVPATPRPTGHAPPPPPTAELLHGLGQGRYLVAHGASRPYHWELRLEGPKQTFTWELPQGMPWGRNEARQATLSDGGAPGPVPSSRWDEGRWRAEAPAEDGVILLLEGRRLRGRYFLAPREGERWTLRRLDPPSVRPMPERVLPMLAHAGSYPADPQAWAFEPKWDGVRTLAHVDRGKVVLRSRTLLDVTDVYPELEALGEALPRRQAILDGEIVAFDERGRASFERLQGRMGVHRRADALLRMREIPVQYLVFDLLYLDGHDTTGLPYEERRGLLESLHLEGDPHWRLGPVRMGDGRGLLEDPDLEGVVAKRLGAGYEPGARSRAWVKVKLQKRQELVIGGWTPGRGSRKGRIGALLVGHYDVTPAEADARGSPPRFLYAGSVGTGFSERILADLQERLEPHRVDRSPFANAAEVDKRDAIFVEPRLVAEFEFTEWTSGGRLRHPSFKGLRHDKDPREVTREERE